MMLSSGTSSGTPTLRIARGGRDGAPTLLLLHGVTRNHGDFAPLLDRLAGDWRLAAVDHRGHGGSGRAARYLVTDYVADTVRLLHDDLREPVVILGHSLGAMVAAGVAAMLPELVRGVVLEDPPFQTMGTRIAGTAWHAQFTGMRAAALRGGSVDAVAEALAEIRLPRPDGGSVRLGDLRDAAALRWSAACLADLDPEVLAPVIAGHWLDGYDLVKIAARVRCPVRLLQADPQAGGALADDERDAFAAAAPRCTVEQFTGSGHLLHWTDPDRVAAAVAALAAELPIPDSGCMTATEGRR